VRFRLPAVGIVASWLIACSEQQERRAASSFGLPPAAPSPVLSSSPPIASAADHPAGAPPENDVSQHAILQTIASSYTTFFRADGMWWAPYDCWAPPADAARMSAAPPGVAHGRKVYTLQIADFTAYARETGSTAEATGGRSREPRVTTVPGAEQVIVKVSYEPTEDPAASKTRGVKPASSGGRAYYPGEQKDLFVMYRPTNKAFATDAGWLYGTVSPDGKTVTSSGQVKSCMGCHQKAPHGRLFGVTD